VTHLSGETEKKHRRLLPPNAMENFEQILRLLKNRSPAIFLDYDGTLTPIVARPENAILSESVRSIIRRLVRFCPVFIVSGRDLADARQRIGLNELYYACSHGFDIAGPNGLAASRGEQFLDDLDRNEARARNALQAIEGILIERKKFSIAIHYREVADENILRVKQIVEAILEDSSGLKCTAGKKVIELQPNLDWNKGKAVAWLIAQVLRLDRGLVLPIYIGDDITDEDAFKELHDNGIGILVGEGGLDVSSAHYWLENPEQVSLFLQRLITAIGSKGKYSP